MFTLFFGVKCAPIVRRKKNKGVVVDAQSAQSLKYGSHSTI